MSRAARLSVLGLAALGALSMGCTFTPSIHAPRYVAPSELVLTYDDGYVVSAAGRPVAKGYTYEGLEGHVQCVPQAREHAHAAAENGAVVRPLQVAGVTLGFAGLGGLAGLAYLDKNNAAAAGLLLGGLGMQLIGLALVGAGAQAKVNANGHAVDAVNYYNDALGSQGGSCAQPARRYW